MRNFVNEFYTTHFINRSNTNVFADDLENLTGILIRFDDLWSQYERKYVFELMVVENDARRFVIESINLEALLRQPHMQNTLLKSEFNAKRKSLLEKICEINAVANEEGKGKNDFNFNILLVVEDLLSHKPTDRGYSKAVKKIASLV